MGYAHPDKLLDELTSSQLSEWEAYNRISPIGDIKEDVRTAYLASTITNLAIDVHGKKGTKKPEIQEYVINWDFGAPEEVKVQSVEDMVKIFADVIKAQKKQVGIQPKNPPRKRK